MPFIRLLMLLTLSLAVTGCEEAPPVTPPVQEPPTEEPTEPGDWSDEGPLAACTFRAGSCGTPQAFDTSACATESLAAFNPSGAYTLHLRAESGSGIEYQERAMRLVTNGQSSLSGRPIVSREVDADTVFFRSEQATKEGSVFSRNLMGCRMPGPDHLVGCYTECINGQHVGGGTFQARRVSPFEPAEGSGLRLVAEPGRDSAGTPADVYVTHGHAYMVALGGGLTVYDVADPTRPVLKTTIALPQDNVWNGVWAKGEALYVASRDRGVVVFDIRNPGAPVLERNVPAEPTNVHTVFVEGNLLFATAQDPDGAVHLYDVTAPLRPVLRSKFLAENFNFRRNYGPHDMLAFEGRLYVNYWGSGYVVASLDNPDAPQELGRYAYRHSTSHANAVGRFGDRLIAFEGGEGWGAHLRVLDVTDPAHIRRIGEWRLREHISIHNMVLVGTKLYVAHYQEGVRVLDVSVPELPRQVAHFNTFRADDGGQGTSYYEGTIGIRVPGDGYVYAVDTSRGLLILREE